MRYARSANEQNFTEKLFGIKKSDLAGNKPETLAQERLAALEQAKKMETPSTNAAYGLVSPATPKVWMPKSDDFNRLSLKAAAVVKDTLEELCGGAGGVSVELAEEVRPQETSVLASKHLDSTVADKALMAFSVRLLNSKGMPVKAHCVVSYVKDATGKDTFVVESPMYVGEDSETAKPVELKAIASVLTVKENTPMSSKRALAHYNMEFDFMEVIPVADPEAVAAKLASHFEIKAHYVDRCYGPEFGRIVNEVICKPEDTAKLVTAVKEIVAGMGGKADEAWFSRADEKGSKDYPKKDVSGEKWFDRAKEEGKEFKKRDWVDRAEEKPEAQSEAKSAYGSDASLMKHEESRKVFDDAPKMERYEQRRTAILNRKAMKTASNDVADSVDLRKKLSDSLLKVAAMLGDKKEEEKK